MKTKLHPRLVLLALIIATCALMTSCNTIRGVGRDVQGVGSAVQRAAS